MIPPGLPELHIGRQLGKMEAAKAVKKSGKALPDTVRPPANEPLPKLLGDLNGERVDHLEPVTDTGNQELLQGKGWVSQMIDRFNHFFNVRERTATAAAQIESFDICRLGKKEAPLSKADLKWIVSDKDIDIILKMRGKSAEKNLKLSFAERYTINRLHDKYFGKNHLLASRVVGRELIQKMWVNDKQFQSYAGNMLKTSKGRQCLVKLSLAHERNGEWHELSEMVRKYSSLKTPPNEQEGGKEKTMLSSFVDKGFIKEKDLALLLKFQSNTKAMMPSELRYLFKVYHKTLIPIDRAFKNAGGNLTDLRQIYGVLGRMEMIGTTGRSVAVLDAFVRVGKLSEKDLAKFRHLVQLHGPEKLTSRDQRDLQKLVGKLKPLYVEFVGETHQKDLIEIKNKVAAWSVWFSQTVGPSSQLKKDQEMVQKLFEYQMPIFIDRGAGKQEVQMLDLFDVMRSNGKLDDEEFALLTKVRSGEAAQVLSEQEIGKFRQLCSETIVPVYQTMTSGDEASVDQLIRLGFLTRNEIHLLGESQNPSQESELKKLTKQFEETLTPEEKIIFHERAKQEAAYFVCIQELSQPCIQTHEGKKQSILQLMQQSKRISPYDMESIDKLKSGQSLSRSEKDSLFNLYKYQLKPLQTLISKLQILEKKTDYLDRLQSIHLGKVEGAPKDEVAQPSRKKDAYQQIDAFIHHEIPIKTGLKIELYNVFELLASHGKLSEKEKTLVNRLTENEGWLSLSKKDKQVLKQIYTENRLDELYRILTSPKPLEVNQFIIGGYFIRSEIDLLRESFRPSRKSVFEQIAEKLDPENLMRVAEALDISRKNLDRASGNAPSVENVRSMTEVSERLQPMIEKLCRMNREEFRSVIANPEEWYKAQLG